MNLYNATFRKWDSKNNESDRFREKYHVIEGWNALKGEHHHYLDPSYGRVQVKYLYVPEFYVGRGIVDLSGMMEVGPQSAECYANLILDRSEDRPRAILFAIDPARPPEATIKELRPYLAKLHKPYKNKKGLDALLSPFLFRMDRLESSRA